MSKLGEKVVLTLFGESHGPAVGAVIEGVEPGLDITDELIESFLAKRRPADITETARIEPDKFKILSGIFNGKTTGAPICIMIPNENVRSSDYAPGIARPSHADYAAHVKYKGFEDYRGGGHFSGRVTAGIVAAGAVAIKALEQRGITIATHILRCGGVSDSPFSDNVEAEIELVNSKNFPVIDDIESAIKDEIIRTKNNGDSIGGIIQTAISGVPAGIGEPWFDSIEGTIAKAVFAIGGVKGIEFGLGFGFGDKDARGSSVNDQFYMDGPQVKTVTNNNGGINGGISNGMPIIFNTAIKPTPSISKAQRSVDFIKGEDISLEIKGRHDPAIIRRICIVVTSVTAITILDILTKSESMTKDAH